MTNITFLAVVGKKCCCNCALFYSIFTLSVQNLHKIRAEKRIFLKLLRNAEFRPFLCLRKSKKI